MHSNLWLIAMVITPFFLGWVIQRYSNGFLTVAAVFTAIFAGPFFLLCADSSILHEHREAIAPFDLDHDGVLVELELNKEARLVLSNHPAPDVFGITWLMPFVCLWTIVG